MKMRANLPFPFLASDHPPHVACFVLAASASAGGGAELTKRDTDMKMLKWGMAVAMAMGLSSAALAGDIQNLSGQSCGDFSGSWHFVNNQTDGAGPGTLVATWDSGDTCIIGPSHVKKSGEHFDCFASGTLLSAYTDLPGRLVLSDFSCENKCTDPKVCECTDPKG